MKKQRTKIDLIIDDIVTIDLEISSISRSITDAARETTILELVNKERKLIRIKQELINRLNGLQNKIVDMGRGPVIGFTTPKRIINQYLK